VVRRPGSGVGWHKSSRSPLPACRPPAPRRLASIQSLTSGRANPRVRREAWLCLGAAALGAVLIILYD
jgi:hypothetical protein